MHRFLAYEYAGWIDVDFKIGTLNVLDNYFSGNLKIGGNEKNLFMLILKMDSSTQKGSFHGRGLAERKREKQELHEKVELLRKNMQPDMFQILEGQQPEG